MWALRDHQAEDRMWTAWMESIAARVSKVNGVTAAVRPPRGLNNHSPGLAINWDPAKLGITGQEVAAILDTTEPRIALTGRGDANGQTGVSITAHMMSPGDDRVVGLRIFQILSERRPRKGSEAPKPPAGDLTGRWDVHIEFAAGSGDHTLHIHQQGNQLTGTHQGDFVARDFSGSIAADDVRIASSVGENHGAALSYRFDGKLSGDTMSGILDMGEYLGAKWTAKRHSFGGGRGQG
jgi:L-seryl-tRNA(Ser) seleniumtransferase